jgi:hypothetical protein
MADIKTIRRVVPRARTRVRPSHRALSGVTIAIDSVFRNVLPYPSDSFCRSYLTISGEVLARDLVLW